MRRLLTIAIRIFVLVVVALVFLLPLFGIAEATFSVVATDGQHLGAAGCSCITGQNASIRESSHYRISHKAVFMAQGLFQTSLDAPVTIARQLLENGTEPSKVVDAMNAVDSGYFTQGAGIFHNVDLRQYGIVDSQGRRAGYTGTSLQGLYRTLGWAPSSNKDVQSTTSTAITFSIQGNAVSNLTVPIMENSLLGSCDLAESLFTALNQVALEGEGDVRCQGQPGTTVFIHIEDIASGSTVMSLDIPNRDGADPFPALRQQFSDWRIETPCPRSASNAPTPVPTSSSSTLIPSSLFPTEKMLTSAPSTTTLTQIPNATKAPQQLSSSDLSPSFSPRSYTRALHTFFSLTTIVLLTVVGFP